MRTVALTIILLIWAVPALAEDKADRLLKALSDPSPHAQATTLAALGKVSDSLSTKERKKIKKKQQLLITKLNNPDLTVRLSALYAVSKLKVSAALPAIEDKLLAPTIAEQSHAALALGRYGQEANGIVPALRLLLKSEDRRLSTSAVVAINSIDGSVQLPEKVLSLPYEERYTVIFTSHSVSELE